MISIDFEIIASRVSCVIDSFFRVIGAVSLFYWLGKI